MDYMIRSWVGKKAMVWFSINYYRKNMNDVLVTWFALETLRWGHSNSFIGGFWDENDWYLDLLWIRIYTHRRKKIEYEI